MGRGRKESDMKKTGIVDASLSGSERKKIDSRRERHSESGGRPKSAEMGKSSTGIGVWKEGVFAESERDWRKRRSSISLRKKGGGCDKGKKRGDIGRWSTSVLQGIKGGEPRLEVVRGKEKLQRKNVSSKHQLTRSTAIMENRVEVPSFKKKRLFVGVRGSNGG